MPRREDAGRRARLWQAGGVSKTLPGILVQQSTDLLLLFLAISVISLVDISLYTSLFFFFSF